MRQFEYSCLHHRQDTNFYLSIPAHLTQLGDVDERDPIVESLLYVGDHSERVELLIVYQFIRRIEVDGPMNIHLEDLRPLIDLLIVEWFSSSYILSSHGWVGV